MQLHQQQRIPEAEALYRGLLAADPSNAEVLRLLALCRYQQGALNEAEQHLLRSLALREASADAHAALGSVRLDGGRPAEALPCFERAAALGARGPALAYNRGLCLQRLGRHADAVAAYDEAAAAMPRDPRIRVNRGEALRAAGHPEAAAESFRAALVLDPRNAMAHNGLGAVAHGLGRLDEALALYDQALALDPANAHALANRGRALGDAGRRNEGVRALEEAVRRAPHDAQMLADLGSALHALRRYGKARAQLDAALQCDPDIPHARGDRFHADQQVCRWERYEEDARAIEREIDAGKPAAIPFTLLSMPVSAATQRRCAEAFVRRHFPASPSPLWQGGPRHHDRIRVGYFSADFHNHPTAHLLTEVLERHDRDRFDVRAYSFGRDADDEWRTRIRRGVEAFHDVREWPAARIAQLARDHEIDIAIDLKGFTLDYRLGIFAWRPAPLQVNYLGYPGTLGAPYIDYVIADATLVGEGDEAGYSEQVVRLPHSYQPNDRARRIAAACPSRAEAGLPDDGFVFCCFNNFFKITPPVFDAWMRILRAVPRSVLWLLDKNAEGVANLRREAAARGLEPGRLAFSPSLPLAEHLARHRLADLFLDTVPCNAHTTASDALWAGLPVLTCRGETFAGRVAASLLGAVGLPELVAGSLPDYEGAAIAIARDPERLARLRGRLAAGRSSAPLFDSARHARHLEAAFSAMWERWQRGLSPAPLAIAEPEVPLH